ncbi:MAG: pentapeptide repeat-containing protein [Deltaproteobacteria bacterium]|uniref:Pentapeptide repeat-containing protein n=1 Tax=Candidatus Zymogenus saltonus TaxID=2844893 RepID=A0A9D8KDA6_9DELT|nr:pentapeptide repeat-containing protein [Candidatus Zymogenus saltonus]
MCDYRSNKTTYIRIDDKDFICVHDMHYICPHSDYGPGKDNKKAFCIFHNDREDKDLEYFCKEFKKLYESGKHDFRDFIFPKDFDFSKLRVEKGGLEFKEANFGGATFSGEADFIEATFSKWANFGEAKFSGVANFSRVTFSRKTCFMEAKFSGKACFVGAKFLGGADFMEATFSERAEFRGAKFSGQAYFVGAKFSGEADFINATFSEKCKVVFRGKTFDDNKKAYFENLNIEKDADLIFNEVNLNCVRFLRTDLSKIDFLKVYWTGRKYKSLFYWGRIKVFDEKFQEKGWPLRNLQLLLYNLRYWLFKLKKEPKEREEKSRLRTFFRKIVFKILKQFKISVPRKREQEHYEVYRLYNQLLFNYEGTNRHHEAGDFFAGQMEMRRRGYLDGKIFSWILLILYKITSEYGERPLRAFGWLLVVWLIFGYVYLQIGLYPSAGGEILQKSIIIQKNIFAFLRDYFQGLIVSLDIMTIGRVKQLYNMYTVVDKPIASVFKFIQTVLSAILLALFLFSINRKFKRK